MAASWKVTSFIAFRALGLNGSNLFDELCLGAT
jgi:hypothetical protein